MTPFIQSVGRAVIAAAAFFGFTAAAQAAEAVIVSPGNEMVVNHPYKSPNGVYSIIFQSDGNLVVYKGSNYTWQNSLWSSGTDVKKGKHAVLQGDGNFVIYDGLIAAGGKAVWDSRTAGKAPSATISDTGVFAVSGGFKTNADPAAPGTNVPCTPRQIGLCMYRGTPTQFSTWVFACTQAEAVRIAGPGASLGACINWN